MREPPPTIVIDTREQRPYRFPGHERFDTLPTGDYTGEGVESILCIERKSLPDLLGCVGQSRERFERELERMLAYPKRTVVCEFGLPDLARGGWRHSHITPAQAVSSVLAWRLRYDIDFLFAGDRAHGAAAVRKLVTLAVRHQLHSMKNESRGGPCTTVSSSTSSTSSSE